MIPHPFHEFPKDLYASGPVTDPATGKTHPSAVQVHNKVDEKVFRSLGYGDTYIPQEYPKQLHKRVGGVVMSASVADATEEKSLKAKGYVTVDKIQGGAA